MAYLASEDYVDDAMVAAMVLLGQSDTTGVNPGRLYGQAWEAAWQSAHDKVKEYRDDNLSLIHI